MACSPRTPPAPKKSTPKRASSLSPDQKDSTPLPSVNERLAYLRPSRQLLEYYRKKIAQFDEEHEELVRRLEKYKAAYDEQHKLQWEMRQREEEIAELQKALSDMQVYLFQEREHVLRLYAENDRLKIRELEDRKKIQHLLALVGTDNGEITYFHKEPPHKVTVSQRLTKSRDPYEPNENSSLKTGIRSSTSKPTAKGGTSESAERYQRDNQTLLLQVEALQAQLEEQARLAKEQLESLLEDRRIRIEEAQVQHQRDQDKIKNLTEKFNKAQNLLYESTRDFLQLKFEARTNEKSWMAEKDRILSKLDKREDEPKRSKVHWDRNRTQGHARDPPDPGHVRGPPIPGHAKGPPDPGLARGPPDPGHARGPPDPGHARGPPDPGHTRGLPIPGHAMGPPIPGHARGPPDPGHARGPPIPGHARDLPGPGHSRTPPGPGHAQTPLGPGHAQSLQNSSYNWQEESSQDGSESSPCQYSFSQRLGGYTKKTGKARQTRKVKHISQAEHEFCKAHSADFKSLQGQLVQEQRLATMYREQCVSLEEELAKIREEGDVGRELFKERSEKMGKRLQLMTQRYEALEKRRGMEVEGYRNDIRQLRQRLKDVEKQLLKVVMSVGPDQDLAVLHEIRQGNQKTKKVQGELKNLKSKIFTLEKELRVC